MKIAHFRFTPMDDFTYLRFFQVVRVIAKKGVKELIS
jgi:hypothetical protein